MVTIIDGKNRHDQRNSVWLPFKMSYIFMALVAGAIGVLSACGGGKDTDNGTITDRIAGQDGPDGQGVAAVPSGPDVAVMRLLFEPDFDVRVRYNSVTKQVENEDGKYFGESTTLELLARAVNSDKAKEARISPVFDATALLVRTNRQFWITTPDFDDWQTDLTITLYDLASGAPPVAVPAKWTVPGDKTALTFAFANDKDNVIGSATLPGPQSSKYYSTNVEHVFVDETSNTVRVDPVGINDHRRIQATTFPYGFTVGIRNWDYSAGTVTHALYAFGGFKTKFGSTFPDAKKGYTRLQWENAPPTELPGTILAKYKAENAHSNAPDYAGTKVDATTYFATDESVLHTYYGSVAESNYRGGSDTDDTELHAYSLGSTNVRGFFNVRSYSPVNNSSLLWVNFYEEDGTTPRIAPQIQALWLISVVDPLSSGLYLDKHFTQKSKVEDGYSFRLKAIAGSTVYSFALLAAAVESFDMKGQFFGPGFEGLGAVYTMSIDRARTATVYYWGVLGMYLSPRGLNPVIGTPIERGLPVHPAPSR